MSGRIAFSAILLVAAGLAGAACGGNGTAHASPHCTTVTTNVAASAAGAGSWAYSNADLANTRDATGSTISSANVARLAEAWTFKLTGKAVAGVSPYGALTANPIVQHGVVYLQDLDSNVYALALATGKLDWEYRCNLYGLTPTTAFALSAATGRTIWVKGDLLRTGQGTFGIQPQVAGGRVYLASQYGSGPGGGVLLALRASSGAVLWRFNTVAGPEPGVKALGLGAGGAWETPLVGSDGSVTYGIGNPYQTPAAAIAHPAKHLYTDSDVNLDAATGKLRWYHQGVPDDFKDWDMQTSPISARTGGVSVVIGSGKMGDVYQMNASTGKLIWKTPVGAHNGHDDDSLPAFGHRSTLKPPFTILPGPLGGVLTDLAAAGKSVYVATLDLPLGGVTVSRNLLFTTLYDGELIALNRTTGAIVYRRRLPTSANSPIAIARNAVIVPAGGPVTKTGGGAPQIVSYTVP